mgnify:FL=1
MAQSKKPHKAPEEQIEKTLGKGEEFFQKNAKTLMIILIAIIVVVGGYFAYTYFIALPKAQKAADEMFVAEQLFGEGAYDTALNGDGANAGLLDVVDTYGGTKPGKLAAHYAGICYIKLGDNDSALTYLEKYKPAKGAPATIINAQNFGLRGDIYADRGDLNKAAELYGKEAEAGDNILTTPHFLKKSAEVYTELGNYAKALEACKRIKDQYGSSLEARDIDKYIGALEQM